MERAWWDGERIVGLMAEGLPAIIIPSELPTLMAPRLIELCFQTAGLWEMGAQGRMGLPLHIDRVIVVAPHPESADGPLVRRGHSRPESRQASMQKLWMRKETATCS